MSAHVKKSHLSAGNRVIKQASTGLPASKQANRSPALRGRPVKTQKKQPKKSVKTKKIEKEYLQLFTPQSLPHHGMYLEEESLEQPSEFIYLPATTAPAA